MGKQRTTIPGVYMSSPNSFAVAIPPPDFDSQTEIEHYYMDTGSVSCFSAPAHPDVFLLVTKWNGVYTAFAALRSFDPPARTARSRYLIPTRNHPECETLAKHAHDRLLPLEYRDKCSVCIPPGGLAPFLFFYFHNSQDHRGLPALPSWDIVPRYAELFREMNMENAATRRMTNSAPQKTNNALCAGGGWDAFITGAIRAFASSPNEPRCPKRRPAHSSPAKRPRAAPETLFSNQRTIEEVLEKLNDMAGAPKPADFHEEPAAEVPEVPACIAPAVQLAFGPEMPMDDILAYIDAQGPLSDGPFAWDLDLPSSPVAAGAYDVVATLEFSEVDDLDDGWGSFQPDAFSQ